ncbi:MAG TPA: bifunctional riboflavin kinase/FAD synthetase [Burkholderiaceae bacterium]|nr:bifunctional riboflavin kinase/FAD synthetase [Burkholderiaceae bacterium]
MKVFRGLPSARARTPCALTIGNFDGVHVGHQALLRRVTQAAQRLGVTSAVMTFEPHPLELFCPQRAPARIAGVRDKLAALEAAGIERVFIMHFNRRFAAMPAQAFIQDVLLDALQVRWLMVGDDFRFGAGRAGDFALLERASQTHGFTLEQLAPIHTISDPDRRRISSSLVRAALAAGDLARARELLGHPYLITGRVMYGRQLGRTLGFPTLNLRIGHRRKMPTPAVHGIFAVRVHGLRTQALPAVASVGLRPTVDDSGRWLLEVHVFDFDEEVYGRRVSVEFIQRLRDEQRFDNLESLTRAIETDAAQARALFTQGLA